jgi:hypothetical protein
MAEDHIGGGQEGRILLVCDSVRKINPWAHVLLLFYSENICIFFWFQDLSNVSTTSSNNPEQVLIELRRALISKGISCKQKG